MRNVKLYFLLLSICCVFSLHAQEPAITIDDVVRIKYVGNPQWSPDSRYISFTWDDQGKFSVWTIDTSNRNLSKVCDTELTASGVTWSDDGSRIAVTDGKKLFVGSPGEPAELVIESKSALRNAQFSDNELFYIREGMVWKYNPVSGTDVCINEDVRPVTNLVLSQDGDKMVYRSGSEIQVMDRSGTVLGKFGRQRIRGLSWLNDSRRVFYYVTSEDEKDRTYYTLNTNNWEEKSVYTEHDDFYIMNSGSVLSPTRDEFLLIRNPDGWDHVWLVSIKDGKEKQLNSGMFEDSFPEWSPDGNRVLFASNRNPDGGKPTGERHLYTVDREGNNLKQLTAHMPGTNIVPAWSPDGKHIAFTHSGPYSASDIYTMQPEAEAKAVRHTVSMPEVWTKDNIVVPEEIIYKGPGDLDIHSWLFKPKGFDPTKKYPAIVWIHGGPIRQMRYGWHPRRGYSLFYSYHQRLLQMGYVVLSINFRGGIGYGKDFQNALHMKMGIDETVDCVNAGKYLRTLDYIDDDRVGIWGLSYGGYMTLQALGMYPDSYCMGINVAGVYNWATQIKIYNGRGRFVRFFGGVPEENPETYRVGSPITYVHNIKVPLYNLQGTADRNVPFSQMDEIVESMVKFNLPFELMYYPGQLHVFQDGDVWRNAFPRIEKFFETHLKNRKK